MKTIHQDSCSVFYNASWKGEGYVKKPARKHQNQEWRTNENKIPRLGKKINKMKLLSGQTKRNTQIKEKHDHFKKKKKMD